MTNKAKVIQEWKEYNIFMMNIRDNLSKGDDAVITMIRASKYDMDQVLIDLHIMDYITATHFDKLRALSFNKGE